MLGDWKRKRGRRRESSEIDSSYCSEIAGFFFFFVRNRVQKVEYEIPLEGAPDVSSGIDFQRRGPIIVPLVLSVPFNGPERLWWGKFWASPHSASSLPPRVAGCFCHQSYGGKSQGNRVCCFYSFQTLSEDTAAEWEISPVGSSC